MELMKNKVYRCRISDYTADGTGFAKIEGRAVFVPRTAVGDCCDVRIVKVTKNVAFGRVEKLVTPSRARITPACPVSDKCGGCCYQHITYEEELRAKEKKVRDALTRIGKQDGEKLLGITGAETTEHYRNKAQYPVGRDREGNIVTGFYRPRSHDIVPVERCLIQSEKADHLAGIVREWMTEFAVPPYDYETKRGTIRHIYVRTGEKSGECQLTLISATRKLPELATLIERLRAAEPSLTGILINHNQRGDNVILGDRTDVLWGEPMLEDRLCGNTFLLSPHAFYQVNHAQAERLYACAVDYAGLTGEETVLDLYCGAGTITLALAAHAKHAVGVEIVPEAIENAKNNARRNGAENVEFYCADAGQAAGRFSGIDVLVVDPPRKGLDETARDAILKMPPRVVYVSCDPATLARDVAELCGAGYTLEKAQAYDLFPRTFHVETVVLLSQQKPDDTIEIDLDLDELDATAAETKATYEEIKAYVWDKHRLKVSSLYISQIKRKCGLEVSQNYNLSKSENPKVPKCPPEKEAAIMDALKHFQMI